MLLAEKILIEDDKPPYEFPVILPASALLDRQKKEIYTASGFPEPHIVQGLYWRTHPQGRRWYNADKRREDKGGFYR